jgi:hypothetical protein
MFDKRTIFYNNYTIITPDVSIIIIARANYFS